MLSNTGYIWIGSRFAGKIHSPGNLLGAERLQFAVDPGPVFTGNIAIHPSEVFVAGKLGNPRPKGIYRKTNRLLWQNLQSKYLVKLRTQIPINSQIPSIRNVFSWYNMWSIALAPQMPRQKQRGLAGRIVENRLWGNWAAPGSQGGMCEPRVTGARLGYFDRQASYR